MWLKISVLRRDEEAEFPFGFAIVVLLVVVRCSDLLEVSKSCTAVFYKTSHRDLKKRTRIIGTQHLLCIVVKF